MPQSNIHPTAASPSPSPAVSDLKRRVLDCLSKLSDRDTQPQAAAELETIAVTVNLRTVPSFISWIQPPDVITSKSAVRTTSLRLLSVLSRHHGAALVPVLPKMVAAVVRRLRDGESASRSACVDAIASMATNVAGPFSAFSKPIATVLFSDQDAGAQTAAALCLASAVDGVAFRDPPSLRRLLQKVVKLLSSGGFKAKPALLALIGSVVDSGGASSNSMVKEVVERMMDCLSSSEWATRKAAAGAFAKLAVAERDLLPEFKASCLKVFEDRIYDKVKAVREAMNDMVEKWKEIPDVSFEASPPPLSHSSCRETVNHGCIPSRDPRSKWHSNSRRFSMPAGSLSGICKQSGTVEHLKASRKAGPRRAVISPPLVRSGRNESDGQHEPGVGPTVFIPNSDSCSPLSRDGIPESVESDSSPGFRAKDGDSLAFIRNRLAHIEHQQSCLLELLKRFISSSEGGIRTIESRVDGVEVMLGKVSFDLAVAGNRQLSEEDVPPTCCVLPGADFFSSRFRTKFSGGGLNPASSPGSPGQVPNNGGLNHKGCSRGKLILNPLA